MKPAPDGPLGGAELSLTVLGPSLVTVRPEDGTHRLWLQEEGAHRPALLLSEEPQVCPVGRPLRFLALAGTFEGVPEDVRRVRVLLDGCDEPIEATTSDRAWIVFLPIDELHQDAGLTGEIIWHGDPGQPYRRRALRSLRAFIGQGAVTRADSRGTTYGPPIVGLDLRHDD